MPGRLARALLLAAIRAYKRHVSPRKGFACAYRVHTGRASCSTLGYRAVSRYGVFRGLGILDERLARCRVEHGKHRLSPSREAPPRSTPRLHPSQAGFVDCDCGGCDLPSFDACDGCSGGDLLEAVAGCLAPDDCGDCGCCDRPRLRPSPPRERPSRERGRAVAPGPAPQAGVDDVPPGEA